MPNTSLETPAFTLLTDIPVSRMSDCLNEIGNTLGTQTTELGLLGYGDTQPLGIHSETIYNRRLCRYFLLGCIQKAETGGESVIIDGLQAARLINEEQPELAGICIEYSTDESRTKTARNDLVRELLPGEQTLCFRQYYAPDRILNLPDKWEVYDFYEYMDTVLDRCTAHVQVLQPGEALIVDNYRTLHSRTAYEGIRKMLRVRVDE